MLDSRISEDELAEMTALVESATPGPWHIRVLDDDSAMNMVVISTVADDGVVRRFPHFDHSEIVAATLIQHPRYVDIADGRWDENARFIAASRDLVPRLIAEIKRLRGNPMINSE